LGPRRSAWRLPADATSTLSRPDVVADVIKTAAAAVSRPVAATAG
jgi:hypothetical protein